MFWVAPVRAATTSGKVLSPCPPASSGRGASALPKRTLTAFQVRSIRVKASSDGPPAVAGRSCLKMAARRFSDRESSSRVPSRSKMRARVRVGSTSRRSTGPIRSGLMENSSEGFVSSLAPTLWPGASCSSFSGSTVIASVSTLAEAEMAAAMISPCVCRLCTRASISPSRNWLT